MKNILKVFIFTILAFTLFIPMQIVVRASTYVEMGQKTDVVVTKPWTVSFNKPLSTTTVNTTSVKVVGENNNYIDIKVSLTSDNKKIIVSPVKNYEANKKYTLIVTQKVMSSDGKPLPKEVRMIFNTKGESVPTKPSNYTVCIDPAQYYKEITGINGAKAKDINLSTALKVGDILKSRGFNVVYSRNSDLVPWSISGEDDAKAAIAKNANSNVFLSINTNNSTNMEATGIETYYLADGSNNKLLASSIQGELIKATNAKDREIKEGTYEILKKTSCPAVMVELGFLSNLGEEKLLSSEEYQNNAAKAIANGLMNYAGFGNTDNNYDLNFPISSVKDITVNLGPGETYVFPKTVQAILSNDSKKEVEVLWPQNSILLNELGTYTYKGVIANCDKKVNVIINVAKRNYKVVLDAGHGGYDSGAVGPTGVQEKTVTLAITLKVGNILAANGVETIYTRTSDNIDWSTNETQNLQARCDIANGAKPNYFISIHANSAISSAVGIETYYYAGNVSGEKLAQAVQTELINETGKLDRGIKTANFYVLKNMDSTSILVETSFVSNPIEEKLLASDDYQNQVAKAISTGILKSLGVTNINF